MSQTEKTVKVSKVKSTTGSTSNPAPVDPAPVSETMETKALASATDSTGPPAQVKEKGRNNSNSIIPGFIFLCNGRTRPRCFKYHVFGLPMTQKKTVERIKPGTKLFLFDYDLRLLYGVYEAASEGRVNLEPDAFSGRFLAQVRFITLEECFPLPEICFKSAIMENYQGTKFTPELTESQVETLISLFHSLPYTPLPPSNTPLPNAPPAQMMLSLPMVEPQRAQTVPVMQHHNYMAGTLGDHVHPGFQHQSFPNPIDPFNAHFQGLHSTGDHIQVTQEPYPRYNSEGFPMYHTMGLGNDHPPYQLWCEPHEQGHYPPEQERNIWYHQPAPSFRGRETTLTGTSGVAAPYTSVPHLPAYEIPTPGYPVPVSSYLHPEPPATGMPVPAYSSPGDYYFSSPMQQFAPPSGRSEPHYLVPSASYASSTMYPYASSSMQP